MFLVGTRAQTEPFVPGFAVGVELAGTREPGTRGEPSNVSRVTMGRLDCGAVAPFAAGHEAQVPHPPVFFVIKTA
jgi:hypothetical protein